MRQITSVVRMLTTLAEIDADSEGSFTSVSLCSDSSASSIRLALPLSFGDAAARFCLTGLLAAAPSLPDAVAASPLVLAAAATESGRLPLPVPTAGVAWPLLGAAVGGDGGQALQGGAAAAAAAGRSGLGFSLRPGSCTASNRPLAFSRAVRSSGTSTTCVRKHQNGFYCVLVQQSTHVTEAQGRHAPMNCGAVPDHTVTCLQIESHRHCRRPT